MALRRHREETVNTQLAILLSQHGVEAEAETLHSPSERPDVLFDLRGLRVAIEGKFSDHPRAQETVLNDARHRVIRGVAHLAVAVVYPDELRTTATANLLNRLAAERTTYCIISEAGESRWFEGTPSAILDALRRAREAMAQDEIVEQTAVSLSARLDAIADQWIGRHGTCDRLSTLLGMSIPKRESAEKAEKRRMTSAKVSALVMANALIFQEQLSATDGRVPPLSKVEKSRDPVSDFRDNWRWIWENVNYVPIFQLAERIAAELSSEQVTIAAFRGLLAETKNICARQSALRHDLMGRIYHWLLHHAKYLGTYYTSVSAATLLLHLALAADWSVDFGDPAQLLAFRVADFACGTGTLLMATAQSVGDSFIRARVDSGRTLTPVDLRTLHRTLTENVIHGYDVLPSAVHLTASTLAMLAPEVSFGRMNLFIMPLGMDGSVPRLGSLDFLSADTRVQTQIALDNSAVETVRAGVASIAYTSATVHRFDLCVMNPPYVRSVGGNLLFGSLPDERGMLQKELKKRVKKIGASATAGLGSVFVALADKHLKTGGRLAFVLPAALMSGEAWADTRAILNERYHLETVIVSHDQQRPNFSENTDLSEIMFIAKKKNDVDKICVTTFINLWRNPRTVYEALDLAGRVAGGGATNRDSATPIQSEVGKIGEVVRRPVARRKQNWTGGLFAQSILHDTIDGFASGRFILPYTKLNKNFPVCHLEELGSLGPDVKRISEGFLASSDDHTPFPAFWNHDSKSVSTLGIKPNCCLTPRKDSPRGPDYGYHLWERAGNILVVERVRLNSHRLVALLFNAALFGNTWWSVKPINLSTKQQKSLVLWLNSSIALLNLMSKRVVTQGAWVKLKQPAWLSMPVLDVRGLDENTLNELSKAYDRVAAKELSALCELESDPVRKEIDDAISDAFDLPSLHDFRLLLAREPGLSGRSLYESEH